MTSLITINKHTTASVPRPHVVYNVQATLNGKHQVADRRYSEFVALHHELGDNFDLPPKRILATSFFPSAWVDDELITERKAGLTTYLTNVVHNSQYQNSPALVKFLSTSPTEAAASFDLEDALPSTLTRTTALALKSQALSGAPDEIGTAATLIAASYYPYWSADSFPPENLDYSRWDILHFAFTTPSSSSGLNWVDGSQAILQRLVQSANASGAGTKVVLSVGGWGGCFYYSNSVSTAANRATFVAALVCAVDTYGLAGIDLDWEYPNSQGAGQPFSSADSAKLLKFITLLRTALGPSKIISAAVSYLPWLGANGTPLTDVSNYAAQMTYVNIMNYDVWGATSTPGPNAPLGNLCGTSTRPQASAQAALAQWKAAGFPASKMVLGLPLYGYVSQSSKTTLSNSLVEPSSDMILLEKPDGSKKFLNIAHPRNKDVQIASKPDAKIEAVANLQSWYGQQIPFSSIVSAGALVKGSDGNYSQAGGFTMGWDDCSDTPFLFNTSQQTVVTYDDTYSLADKAAFAKANGMAGCFTWSLNQDDGVTLQNVIRAKLGKS
ncbi:glycoside hydrolase family 18 protein [Mycena floridula]|nr:glycoside hydrolase family 18 protein [Mycena floridula]